MTEQQATAQPGRRSRLSKLETARGLRFFLLEGTLSSLWNQLVGGPIFTGFALFLGATDAAMGVLAALPALGNLMQFLFGPLTQRVRDKKRYIVVTAVLHNFLWVGGVLVPLLFPRRYQLIGFGLVVAIASIVAAMPTPAYNAWFAELVPENIRALYISRRNTVMALVGMLGGIGAGAFLDLAPGYRGFLLLYSFGLLVGLSGRYFLARVPAVFSLTSASSTPAPVADVSSDSFSSPAEAALASAVFRPAEALTAFWQDLVLPWQHPRFRNYCLFYFFWALFNGLILPFQNVYLIRNLQVPYAQIGTFTALTILATVLTFNFWGFLVQKFGSLPVLRLSFLLSIPLALFWTVTVPGNYLFTLTTVSLLGGVFAAGAAIASTNLLYEIIPPDEKKPLYWGFFATVVGAAGFIAPVIGGQLARVFAAFTFNAWGFPLSGLQLLFFTNSLLLWLPYALISRLRPAPHVQETPVRYLVGQLRTGNPISLAYHLNALGKTTEERTRVEAVKNLGKLKSPLAVEKLINALDDASTEVRKEAARALGEIRAPEAVEPLLNKVWQPETGIRSEAAAALGKIRDLRGLETLLSAMRDTTDQQVQISAISALGELGGERVREELFRYFQETTDPHLLPALAEALSRVGEVRLIPRTYMLLDLFSSPVIKLQLLGAVARVVGEGGSFARLAVLPELEQCSRGADLLAGISKRLRSREWQIPGRKRALVLVEQMRRTFAEEDYEAFLQRSEAFFSWLAEYAPATRSLALEAIGGFFASGRGKIEPQLAALFLLSLLDTVTRTPAVAKA